MADERKWIPVTEAAAVWKLPPSDILSRLKEGFGWVRIRQMTLVSVGKMCQLYGRGPWVRWGVCESAEDRERERGGDFEQISIDQLLKF